MDQIPCFSDSGFLCVYYLFCTRFLKTYCALSPTYFSLSPQHRDFSISGYTCPTLRLCLYSLCVSLSPLSFSSSLCLCLSLSLTVCISFKCLSILVTLFPSLPPHAHPKCVFLCRPGPSLGTSLHRSSHMGLTTIVSLRSAGLSVDLSLFTMLLSQSIFLSLSLSSSLQDLVSLWLYVRATQSLSLSLCLACPLSVSLLLLCLQVTAHLSLSLPFSLLSLPSSPHSLSLHGSPAHLPKPLLASRVPNL